MSDVDFIADQMRAEAGVLDLDKNQHRCYWCGSEGPGLFWLPSEYGVIEMATWNCSTCIIDSDSPPYTPVPQPCTPEDPCTACNSL